MTNILFSFLKLWGCFALISFAFSLLIAISGTNIFKAAEKESKYSLIPFYNLLIILDIVKLKRYVYVLYMLPVVNVLIIFYILYRISIMFNTNSIFALGLIVLPVIFLPILNYSKLKGINNGNDKIDSVNLMSDEEIASLNKEEDNKIDNVFKSKNVVEHEEVPYFKANNTIKYREMMLKDEKIDRIKSFEPINIESIKENKDIKEDDSIEIVEL